MQVEDFRPGEPPHVGWWFTDRESSRHGLWRWWNGTWSVGCGALSTPEIAASCATIPAIEPSQIRWSSYYPFKARVPRIDPGHQVLDGVEHYPAHPQSFMRCCDCGLEHRVKYRVYHVLERNGDQVTIVPLEDDGRYQVGVTAWRV